MDPNSGRFVSEEEAQAWMTYFEIGETVKVKGEEFAIERIEERQLILKPLSAQERQERNFQAVMGIQELRKEMVRGTGPFANRHDRRTAEVQHRAKKGKR